MIETPRIGDFELNQVYQGDCLKLMRSLPDGSVDLVVTDPPYGMDYQSNRRVKHERFAKIENDQDLSWFPELLSTLYRLLKDESHAYIFCSWRNHPEVSQMLSGTGFKSCGLIVWDKMSHGTGDLYAGLAPCHEFILFLQKGRRLWNGNSGQPQRQRQRPYDIIRCARVNAQNMIHPTEKPVELLGKLILQSSDEGDLVLDPYSGSGATAVACQNHNRNYLGFELSDDYVQKSRERLKQGQLFSQPEGTLL